MNNLVLKQSQFGGGERHNIRSFWFRMILSTHGRGKKQSVYSRQVTKRTSPCRPVLSAMAGNTKFPAIPANIPIAATIPILLAAKPILARNTAMYLKQQARAANDANNAAFVDSIYLLRRHTYRDSSGLFSSWFDS